MNKKNKRLQQQIIDYGVKNDKSFDECDIMFKLNNYCPYNTIEEVIEEVEGFDFEDMIMFSFERKTEFEEMIS